MQNRFKSLSDIQKERLENNTAIKAKLQYIKEAVKPKGFYDRLCKRHNCSRPTIIKKLNHKFVDNVNYWPDFDLIIDAYELIKEHLERQNEFFKKNKINTRKTWKTKSLRT